VPALESIVRLIDSAVIRLPVAISPGTVFGLFPELVP
jgi:hypothetical protein